MSDQIENSCKKPSVEIFIEPEKKTVKFRYPIEGEGRGGRIKGHSTKGEHNTEGFITYPAIKIKNFSGPAVIIVSLVTTNDFKQHPFKLVGKSEDPTTTFINGICKREVEVEENKIIIFNNLRIQCIKKNCFEESMNLRKEVLEHFPYCNGFYNLEEDLDRFRVRLCFQIFLNWRYNVYQQQLPPAISNIICDKKVPDLVIKHISRHFGYVTGGAEMILLCEKIKQNDIIVIFYQHETRWKVEINDLDIFKQIALIFKIPQYERVDIAQPIQVFIKLYSKSQDEYSQSIPFHYLPVKELNRHKSFLPKKLKLDLNELNTSEESRTFSEILNDTVSFLQNVGPQNLENLVPSGCPVTPRTSTIPCRPENIGSAVAPSTSGSLEKVRKRSKKSTTTRASQKLSSRRQESSSQTSQGSIASSTMDGSISNSSSNQYLGNIPDFDVSTMSSTVSNAASNLDLESFRRYSYTDLESQTSTSVRGNLSNSTSCHQFRNILDLDDSNISFTPSNLAQESNRRQVFANLESQPSTNLNGTNIDHNFRNILDLNLEMQPNTILELPPFLQLQTPVNLQPEMFTNTNPRLEESTSLGPQPLIDFETQEYINLNVDPQSGASWNIMPTESYENLEYQPVIELLLGETNDLNKVYRPEKNWLNLKFESSVQANNSNSLDVDAKFNLLNDLNRTPNNCNHDSGISSSEFPSTPTSINLHTDYTLGDAEDIRFDTDELKKALEEVAVTDTNNLRNLSGDLEF